jgi:hypothetical protein
MKKKLLSLPHVSIRGALLLQAEIIPLQPDPGNAGVGIM